MRKMSKRMLQVSSALGLILTTSISKATECTPAPDCASLGYSKTATDCKGVDAIKCPFDTSKLYCQKEETTTPSDGYPCSSENYLVINSTTIALMEYCAAPEPGIMIKRDGLLCKATGKTPDILSPSMIIPFPSAEECTANFQYAMAERRVGCCDSQGKPQFHFPIKVAPTTTYKVGDTYVKDGVALGKVVEVDSTGKHGTVAISRGKAASSSEARTTCNNTSAGGLLWSLAKCEHYCQLLLGGDGFSTDCGYCSCVGPSDFCYSGTRNNLAVACSAPF